MRAAEADTASADAAGTAVRRVAAGEADSDSDRDAAAAKSALENLALGVV